MLFTAPEGASRTRRWPVLGVVAILLVGCTSPSDDEGSGPLEPAPGATIGHWVAADDPVATLLYTELMVPQGSLVVDVESVDAGEVDGLTVIDSGLVPVPVYEGTQLSYIDGPLPDDVGEEAPVADVFVGSVGDPRNSFAFLSVLVEEGHEVAELSGVKVRYRVGDESYELRAAHSLLLCVGEPTGPCAPAA